MIAYFPTIYPDELLASVIARHHLHTRSLSHRATHLELYGIPHSRTSVNFPRNLANFHFITQQFTGLKLQELVEQTTLYPYYFEFASDQIANETLAKMLSHSDRSHSIVLGWSTAFERMKICPECVKDDTASRGEAYWHRSHQLHAAHLCSTHATPLLIANTRYFNDYSTPLEPLNRLATAEPYLPFLSEKTRQRLLEIARRGEACLNAAIPADEIDPFSDAGRRIFRAVYPLTKSALDMTQIERDLIAYFGEQCLELLELPIVPGVWTGWVRAMFRQNPSPMPTKHIVFRLFTQNHVMQKFRGSQADVYDRIPPNAWACKNLAAGHFGAPVVRDVSKVASFNQTGVLRFRCECGFVFMAKSQSWDFSREPEMIKVQKYGDIFVATVREHYRDGVTVTEISRKFNVRRNIVYSMLQPSYGTFERPRPEKAITARKEKRAAAAPQALPAAPQLNDKGKKVDYEARDNEFVGLVVRAAATIRLTSPPVRASVNRILEVAGITYSQLVRKRIFRRTLSKLEELSETTESIGARRRLWKRLNMGK